MAEVNVGELLIRIKADMKKLEDALKQSGKQVQTFSDKVTSVGKNLTSAGLKLSLAVTTPLVLIGKNALSAAQNVVESENLFTVSMGKMADSAREWSNEFAKSVGLNEYNVRKNLGTFNVMFDSMGLGTQKSYELAKGLTSLAYDMASFYNLNVEDAFLKLQSGITGEIEPLKRLGIVVNETTVANYAYTHGIAAQGEQLTEQQKIMARYGAIMEATSKAQGDLARTLDSPANQMRIFKEQVQLAMIELGKGLIPVVQQTITIIKPYIEKFANASDETKNFVVKLGLVAAAAGPVLLFLGNAAKAVGTLKTTLMTTGGSVTAIVAGFIALNGVVDLGSGKLENMDSIWGKIGGTLLRVLAPLTAVKDGLSDNITIAKAMADGLIDESDARDINIFTIKEHIERIKELREEQEKESISTEDYIKVAKDMYDNTDMVNIKIHERIEAQREGIPVSEEDAAAMKAVAEAEAKAKEEAKALMDALYTLTPSEVTADDKTDKLKQTMADMAKVTMGAVAQAIELKKAIDALESKTIYLTTFYRNVTEGNIPGRIAAEGFDKQTGKGKQTGGEISETGFIPDLRIIGIRGEGLLQRDLMNAIKTNRTDYMGITARSEKAGIGNGIVMNNTFNSPKPLTESEINRNLNMMVRELGYRMGLT